MKNIILKFGLIIGVSNFLWLVTEFLAGLHSVKNIDTFAKVTPFAMLIPVAGIIVFYAQLKKRNLLQNTFSKKFVAGFKVTVIFTIISVAGQLVYHILVNTGYFDTMIEYAKKMGQEHPENYFSLLPYLLQILIYNAIIGIVVSLICAAIFKPKKIEIA